jgi:hypothetical protein
MSTPMTRRTPKGAETPTPTGHLTGDSGAPSPTGLITPVQESPKVGRPTDYSLALAAVICDRLSDGESLRAICKDPDMPGKSTVFEWLAAIPEFADLYARAREEQAETLAAEIVAIADEECTMVRASKHGARADDPESGEVEVVFDATAVARNRLRVDARKWVAAKLKPRVYGDKLALTDGEGKPVAPVEVHIHGVAPPVRED